MLEIKNVTKVYVTGDLKQKALDSVSINFRKCEFASILGPSGSGKTTLLNIIGGLDHYTSGDLVINGISTKKYKDGDWDSYRNHRIGFVFQNYNLISHQSILQNVILALTLSGISKSEGIRRAKKALSDVGLGNQIHKKPNQLSGGQMQRVAIARALVNDPDILLADEPTGALDSETSVQIMNLLKEISKDKLVIMVTHNPELAKEYSSRIINLKDGHITSDTNPFDGKKEIMEDSVTKKGKVKKTNMSFLTALSLSFNNLMTKKGRTILVSFAGSIGIIGIALILSLSTGFQNYIDKLQEDTLSSYPLTITEETADTTSMLLSMVSGEEEDITGEKVLEKQYLTSMFSNISTNDLTSFKKYLEENYNKVEKDISSIKYSYSVSPLIYTIDAKKNLSKVNPSNLFSSFMGGSSSMLSNYSSIFSQMIDDKDKINEQYDILKGRLPEKYNEMILVLSEKHTISDLLVYSLGLRDTKELNELITKVMSGETVELNNEALELSYDDLLNIELKLLNATDLYKYNSKYNIYEDMSSDKEYMKSLYDKGINLKIVGILCSKDGNTTMTLNPGVNYTSSLIDYVVSEAYKTDIVKKQINNKEINVLTNKKFNEEEKSKKLDFQDMISVDEKVLKEAFGGEVDKTTISTMMNNYMNDISSSITTDTSVAKKDFSDTLKNFASGILKDYINNSEDDLIHLNDKEIVVSNYLKTSEVTSKISEFEKKYVLPSSYFNGTYSGLLNEYLKGYIKAYYKIDPSLTDDDNNPCALVKEEMIDSTVTDYMNQVLVIGTIEKTSSLMTETEMKKEILTSVSEMSTKLMSTLASSFKVDPSKIASAFKFNLSEDELQRLMSAMYSKNDNVTYTSNLVSLGYQDKDHPTMISFYFNSFDGKEDFLDFIDDYNELKEKNNEESKVLNFVDTTGILMGSVKKIVDSVSYVLIAFVSISLIVSSIMIGIITYISVLERTKEIGILRAIGASKRNISSIFNAETFIIGLLSGIFGIVVTILLIIPINIILHSLTGNLDISAALPVDGAIILVVLSIILTLIGGIIPSKKASRKDPVEALRTE